MYRILRGRAEGLRDDVIGFTRDLVGIPSPSLEEGPVADRVEDQMRRLAFDEVVRDEAGNVIGVIHGRKASPVLMLNGHMDTAHVDGASLAEAESGHDVGAGCLRGAGASDCKSGLASLIYAADLLKRSLLPLEGTLIVAGTVAEEMGGSGGMRALLQDTLPSLHLEPSFAILGEPTDLGLYYGHDGWADLTITVEGQDPFQVEDAAQAIFSEIHSDVGDGVGRGGIGGLDRPSFRDGGGTHRAEIRLDQRLATADAVSRVLRQMSHTARAAAAAVGAVAVGVAVRRQNERLYTGRTILVERMIHAWAIDPFHPLMIRARHALAAAECEVRPGKWQLHRPGMGTAGGVLVNEFHVPTIGYGPGLETVSHAPGEYVEQHKIVEAVYGTAAIVHSLIGIPVFGWTANET
jgi:acetylornithine deacetylase/succinyl-diaminopimelate desuccinylase-like protein